MEGVSKGDKIPERPSAEGFSLSSRAKSHCRSTCSVKKPWRAFLRTSYPRFRSANSAKFRFAQLARSSKSHYRSTYSRPQPKIPERPSAEGFSLSSRVKLHFVQLTRSSKSRSAPLTRGHRPSPAPAPGSGSRRGAAGGWARRRGLRRAAPGPPGA